VFTAGLILVTGVLVWAFNRPDSDSTPTLSTVNSGQANYVQAPALSPEFERDVAALDCLDPSNLVEGPPDEPKLWLGTCDRDGIAKVVAKPAILTGASVTDAFAMRQQGGDGWDVALTLDSEGAAAFSAASQELSALPDCGPGGPNPCNALAVVLDGLVVFAPRINEPILGNGVMISAESQKEAEELAEDLSNKSRQLTFRPVWRISDPASTSSTRPSLQPQSTVRENESDVPGLAGVTWEVTDCRNEAVPIGGFDSTEVKLFVQWRNDYPDAKAVTVVAKRTSGASPVVWTDSVLPGDYVGVYVDIIDSGDGLACGAKDLISVQSGE